MQALATPICSVGHRFVVSGVPPTFRWVDPRASMPDLLDLASESFVPDALLNLAAAVRDQRQPRIQLVDHNGRVVLVRLVPVSNSANPTALEGELYDVTNQLMPRIAEAYGAGLGFMTNLFGAVIEGMPR